MRIRYGNQDVIVGYERRGQNFVLYTMYSENPPALGDQKEFTTIEAAHIEWARRCQELLDEASNILAHVKPTAANEIRIEEYGTT